MRRAFASALLSLGFAHAGAAHAGLTLNAGWLQERERETELPAAGYSAGLSIDLGDYAWVGYSYSNLRTDLFEDALDGVEGRLEYRSHGPSVGVAWPWADEIGLTASGGYAYGSTRGLDGFHNDRVADYDGPTGSLSLWLAPVSWLSVSAGRGYSYVGEEPGWDNSAGVGLRLWGGLWVDGGYWRGEATDGWSAGLRTWID